MKVCELEEARSDLHEINCKERGSVHELTLANRQLQLSEAALRDQLANSQQLHAQQRAELIKDAKSTSFIGKIFWQDTRETGLNTNLATVDGRFCPGHDRKRAELDSSSQRVTHLEAATQRSRDSERELTERCGELRASATLAWSAHPALARDTSTTQQGC